MSNVAFILQLPEGLNLLCPFTNMAQTGITIMPQEYTSYKNHSHAPCYNPTSMDEYNPIEVNRRPPQGPYKPSRNRKSPLMWGLLMIFLITLVATVYLTYSVVRGATAARFGLSTPPGLSLNEIPAFGPGSILMYLSRKEVDPHPFHGMVQIVSPSW